jgi:predicted alpha/beta hydrolase family esterase
MTVTADKCNGAEAMRTSDLDILFVPDGAAAPAGHWQDRWRKRLSTARHVAPSAGATATRSAWTARLAEAVAEAARPVVLVGHGLGTLAIVHAAPSLSPTRVKGAFLVAPLSAATVRADGGLDPAFAGLPSDPLPFPSVLVASRNDPAGDFAASEDLGFAWGSAFVDAGEAGHIDAASGHGPWPEGLLRFAAFLAKL